MVKRFNYICPKCHALYCKKCAEALTNLENACWACNEPFDESKPIKDHEWEDDDIDVKLS